MHHPPTRRARHPAARRPIHLEVEALESRWVPYSVSGNAWPRPDLITVGIVPDGTVIGANAQGPIHSDLQSAFDNHANATFRANWRREIYRAVQVWAQQANLNFAIVSDSGADMGTGLFQQGDPAMADIRIGGNNFGTATLAQAYAPPPINNYSVAGDIQFNTGASFWIGSMAGTKDLFTVASHEIGHGLGLYHSALLSAVMYGNYTAPKPVLNADDVNGVRVVYGGARAADAYDGGGGNNSFANASDLTGLLGLPQVAVNNLDLSTSTDKDFYKLTVPLLLGGVLNLRVQGQSLVTPKVTVYAANQTTVLASATAQGDYDGASLTLNIPGVTALSTVYVVVEGAETQAGSWQAFNTGAYALSVGLGGLDAPTVALPLTGILNGNPLSSGGGQALMLNCEFGVNTTTANTQTTSEDNRQAVAMDAHGNYVVVWMSDGQDGGGKGVYGRRYASTGTPLDGEFRVNTTTSNDQVTPVVAMNDSGAFVVAWASNGQDGGGWGIYAQRYDAAGVKSGGEFRVNTTTSNDQVTPVVAMSASGAFVVAWASDGQDGGGWGVYAQRYSSTGTKAGSEFRANTTTSGAQLRPAAAMDDSGNFVLTWSSNGQDGSGYGVYAKRYNAAGTAQGSEFRVNGTTGGSQDQSSVAMTPTGEFVVAWASHGQDGAGWGVYARRYNAAGVAQGSEFQVNSHTQNNQELPVVALDNHGNFLITWTSEYQDGDGKGVFAQQYAANGATQGLEFRVNTSTSADQAMASVAMSSSGDAVVVWTGSGGGDALGLFAQQYKVNGGSGLSNLKAGEPHGYGEAGSSCGDGCGDEDDHDHFTGCCCLTCATVADGRPTTRPADPLAPAASGPGQGWGAFEFAGGESADDPVGGPRGRQHQRGTREAPGLGSISWEVLDEVFGNPEED